VGDDHISAPVCREAGPQLILPLQRADHQGFATRPDVADHIVDPAVAPLLGGSCRAASEAAFGPVAPNHLDHACCPIDHRLFYPYRRVRKEGGEQASVGRGVKDELRLVGAGKARDQVLDTQQQLQPPATRFKPARDAPALLGELPLLRDLREQRRGVAWWEGLVIGECGAARETAKQVPLLRRRQFS
jgi:hypothetical protein